jgi:hypothetical protein
MEKREDDEQPLSNVVPEIARKKITKRRRLLTMKRRKRVDPL